MKTWYTQPEGEAFSSFYYYEEASRELVRIRLELGRRETETDPGNTIAIYRSNRIVGFTKFLYSKKESARFAANSKGKMIDNRGTLMGNKPKPGGLLYDFSSDRNGRSLGTHQGNTVIDEGEANLPSGIHKGHLERLAEICMKKKDDMILTGRDAAEEQLVAAIKKAIETEQGSMEEDIPEVVSDVGDTTTSHRPRRRRHRCTII
jgi:hypothetical protein